jgi:hypothetical protein
LSEAGAVMSAAIETVVLALEAFRSSRSDHA